MILVSVHILHVFIFEKDLETVPKRSDTVNWKLHVKLFPQKKKYILQMVAATYMLMCVCVGGISPKALGDRQYS